MATVVLSCTSTPCCCDVINFMRLLAKIDARLCPSLSGCFLNFCDAVVQKHNGVLTSLSILSESEKRAQYLQYTPSTSGEYAIQLYSFNHVRLKDRCFPYSNLVRNLKELGKTQWDFSASNFSSSESLLRQ